ncbi:PhzF family phenazine biosynthesis isomerase [Rhizobium leguminosarum bv. viciae]|nr:PhzF family phenazine biosynthesis isomerase [Rhizobium leguminosarum bv. viciae]
MSLYQVDAFATQPFTGNPAAVLVLEDWLADATMLAIAEENNVAMTCFVRRGSTGWDLRWFTPTMEASFCGHGTMATAHILATEMGIEENFQFSTLAGVLTVSRQTSGYALDIPTLAHELVAELPENVAGLLPSAPRTAFRSSRSWFIELADEAAIRSFVPDLPSIATLHPLSFVITAPGERHDFVSRHFAPGAGVPEDSVTGSTHATLVPYWAQKLRKQSLSAFQCSKRGGRLDCELHGDKVRIIGDAVTYLKGQISFG